MAWQTKYRVSLEDFFYMDCEINILYDGYSGDVTQLYAANEPGKWSGPSNNREKTEWIKGQSLELDIINITFEQYTNDFKDKARNQILCQFKRDGNTIFYGFYVPDELSEPYFPGPNILHLMFTDGLGLLKEEKYMNGDVIYYGEKTLMQVLYDCLNKTGLLEDVMGSFHEACIFYAVGQDMTDADSPLTQTNVSAEHFIVNDDEISCYEVLERILISQASRIEQRMGSWYITPLECLKQAHVSRQYTAYGGTYNYVNYNTLDYSLEITGGSVTRNLLNCFINQSQKREIHKAYRSISVKFELQKRNSINFTDDLKYFNGTIPINWVAGSAYTGNPEKNNITNDIQMLYWPSANGFNYYDRIRYRFDVNSDISFAGLSLSFDLNFRLSGLIEELNIYWDVELRATSGDRYKLRSDGSWLVSGLTHQTYNYTNSNPGNYIANGSVSISSEQVTSNSLSYIVISLFRSGYVTPALPRDVYFESCSLKFTNAYDAVSEQHTLKETINIQNNKSKEIILKLGGLSSFSYTNSSLVYFNGLRTLDGLDANLWNNKNSVGISPNYLHRLILNSLISLHNRDMWLLEGTMISTDMLPVTRIIDSYNNKIYMLAEFEADIRFCKFFVTLLEIDETGAYILKESGESGDEEVIIEGESGAFIELE